jgi:hypothetical protein
MRRDKKDVRLDLSGDAALDMGGHQIFTVLEEQTDGMVGDSICSRKLIIGIVKESGQPMGRQCGESEVSKKDLTKNSEKEEKARLPDL